MTFLQILHCLKLHPKAGVPQLQQHLSYMFNRKISNPVLSRLLHLMGWSWRFHYLQLILLNLLRVPVRFQTYKYTYQNLLYYAEYLTAIQDIPWTKLKFADEAHIVSVDLGHKSVLGLVGTRTYTKEKTIHNASASLTILTTLDSINDSPLVVDYRIASNTQWDFADFLLYCCEEGQLVDGDYIIVDNATIHSGLASYEVMSDILGIFNVRLIKLPAYSPELNPCELVFAKLKAHIRGHREDPSLMGEVIRSLAQVSADNSNNFYSHCILPSVILPEFFV
jgi:hypothetical protein